MLFASQRFHLSRKRRDAPRLRLGWLITGALFAATAAMAQTTLPCKVLDPELQSKYSGGCVGGLADGRGEAVGIARYTGEFKSGRKHGQGVKTWPSGDRYEGGFVEDRKQGTGTYTWGAGSPWAGERYYGGYANDRRNGFGVYEWPSGDRYAGEWKDDATTGTPTAQMFTRARAEQEHAAAVSRPGITVCRAATVGIGTPDVIRGTVLSFHAGKIEVRIDDPGRLEHTLGHGKVEKGAVISDAYQFWVPCKVDGK